MFSPFERLRPIRHLALDMDGTIYSGGTLFSTTLPFLQLLRELRVGYTFLTNNSSKSIREYLTHLRRMGIDAGSDQLYSSTLMAMEFLRRELPAVEKLFVLGTPGMIEELESGGYHSTADSAADEPDAVVVGFDTGLVFSRLCRAAYWIQKGKPYIATHPDRVCPTDQPTVLVDCGSICAALEEASGRAPDVVLGKPDARMLEGVLKRQALKAEKLAMVGDRLYTDMAMARNAGALGVLVLTGETTREQAAEHRADIGLVVQGLGELGELLRRANTS